MRWVVTTRNDGADGAAHGHVEVIDPTAAAVVINEINDEVGQPVSHSLDRHPDDWICPDCGFEPRTPAAPQRE